MKNKRMIVSLMAIMLLMSVPMALATETTITWDGGGSVDVDTLVNDDDRVDFFTSGFYIGGSLYLNDGAESFGVSSFNTHVDANVQNGFIGYRVDRFDSYVGCEKYGPLERSSISTIDSTGTASLVLNVHSDYANFQTSEGNFIADGVYLATHRVENGIGRNFAYFGAVGDGTLDLHHELDRTQGNYDLAPISFGAGWYSYSEKAHVTQTGSGIFELGAHYENSFTMGGMTVGGPVDYLQRVTFSDGFSWSDYSFSGN